MEFQVYVYGVNFMENNRYKGTTSFGGLIFNESGPRDAMHYWTAYSQQFIPHNKDPHDINGQTYESPTVRYCALWDKFTGHSLSIATCQPILVPNEIRSAKGKLFVIFDDYPAWHEGPFIVGIETDLKRAKERAWSYSLIKYTGKEIVEYNTDDSKQPYEIHIYDDSKKHMVFPGNPTSTVAISLLAKVGKISGTKASNAKYRTHESHDENFTSTAFLNLYQVPSFYQPLIFGD